MGDQYEPLGGGTVDSPAPDDQNQCEVPQFPATGAAPLNQAAAPIVFPEAPQSQDEKPPSKQDKEKSEKEHTNMMSQQLLEPPSPDVNRQNVYNGPVAVTQVPDQKKGCCSKYSAGQRATIIVVSILLVLLGLALTGGLAGLILLLLKLKKLAEKTKSSV